jgi:putative NIF3 family GTP cyclohydrolase 1 type 2
VKEQAKGWAVAQVEGLAKQAEAQAAIQNVDPLVTEDQHHPEYLEWAEEQHSCLQASASETSHHHHHLS